eukprot:GEMP01049245.1.p1 GENE.GEMP01049245.1~~GEMP01049245.1.p1  ORF type:complete len:298 (+),score=81.47 GEMP01049245.1:249-1142(+)
MVKDADEPDRSAKDAMGRSVWDKEFFGAKAKKRVEGSDDEDEKFVPLPASQREYLRGRNADLKLTANLNKFKLVTDQTSKAQRGGYWCNVCECLLKDSQVYLDHINGRPHNRRLGMTMKVEKVSVEDVKAKLASLRKGGIAKPESQKTDEPVEEGIEARLARLEEEQRLKKERKKEKKRKKDTSHRNGNERLEEPDFLPEEDTLAAEESAAKKLKVDDDAIERKVESSEVEPEVRDDAKDATRESDAIEPKGGAVPAKVESDQKKTEDADDSDNEEPGMSAEDIASMKAMGLPVGFS